MTPGARAAAAIEILEVLENDRSRPADRFIDGWFRQRRYAGGGDRRDIRDLVYTVLRHRAQIDWWIEREGGHCDSRSRIIAAVLLESRWKATELEAAFDGGQYRPDPLDRQERRLTALAGRPYADPDQPFHVRSNIPAWLENPFRVVLGAAMERELSALSREAPVDLRVNTLKASRPKAMAALAARGIAAEPTPYSPCGIRLHARVNLGAMTPFRDGLVEPQDEASQIAALLVEAGPGESVVDFCAGGGGKTLALAAAMQNRGRLVASDTSRRRLDRAAPRLRRAGVTCVDTQIIGSDTGLWPGAEEGGFHRVLVDAPCSATGTWRRNPDQRWRLSEEDLREYQHRQRRILDDAARLVAPGGRLVYAVCSLLGSEGEEQVRMFLARNSAFEVLPVRRIWAGAVGGGCPAGDAFLRLLPGRDGTDGFFVALMCRG